MVKGLVKKVAGDLAKDKLIDFIWEEARKLIKDRRKVEELLQKLEKFLDDENNKEILKRKVDDIIHKMKRK